MKTEKIVIWEKDEYSYSMAFGFIPNVMTYLHDEDEKIRPAVIVVPGGGYCVVSPTEGEIVAKRFYEMGYQTFVLTYTTNILMNAPLKDQPMKDLARAIRLIRKNADSYRLDPEKLAVCGFSAGAHLCGSVSVHFSDIQEENPKYQSFSARPNATILSYPVITAGESGHMDSFKALLGMRLEASGEMVCTATKEELDYMSLEKQVTPAMPPCFLWQTATDELVPVENSYLFAQACKENGVPYAHHVFSDGRHGLSIADQTWASGAYGEPYTMEQTMCVMEAIKTGLLPFSEEEKKEILGQFDFQDPGKAPECQANEEAQIWPVLADCWMRKQFS